MVNQVKYPWVVPVVILSGLAILFLDSLTPLGFADFIFYFAPVALTVLQTRAAYPIYTALYVTILAIIGFFISPAGAQFNVAITNRSYAILTLWIITFLVRQIIVNRNAIDKNMWVQEGLNQLSDVIRGELSTTQLGDNILAFLSKYTKLKVGAIFIKDSQNQTLHYTTGFAFKPKDQTMSLEIGENLLAQAAKDSQVYELHSNESNLKLSSTFNEQVPAHVICVPLVTDRKVIGAMEIGYETRVGEEVIELLSKSSETLGIAMRSVLHKMRLSELLQEAQQMAEELQAQQEELKVSNEELEQQARALQESHYKMENQQAEMEQTNQQLEEQTRLLESQKLDLDEKNAALNLKARELSEASQYKSEFLANMSHELRTPLNSSLILARLLADNKSGNLNPEQIKYAEIIHTSGLDLLNLINDILDLSKVEAGKMTVNPEVVHLKSMVESLEESFQPQASLKSLDYKIEVDPKTPPSLITDRQRLEQVLRNFIANAIKFTEKGHVLLKIYPSSDDKINFAVTDSGIGISPEQKDIIFEAFRQADGTTNRKYGGTGLGLSISKELTKLLGGTIEVQSSKGEGSTFILSLPKEFGQVEEAPVSNSQIVVERTTKPKSQETRTHAQFSFKDDRETVTKLSRKILIIEDEESFARILFDLGKEMGYSVLAAPTAEEGLRMAKEYLPNAILLDIRLPDHSGMLVLDQLKMNSVTRHIPVHIISSTDFSRSAMEMGAIGFMLKPVKREQLQSAFSNLASMMSQKDKRVLVVEDDEVQRNHIVELISDPFVKVDAVSTAHAALEQLSKRTFDCMIMDLTLPDMPGHELLAKLSNENQEYAYPPVIVYTARDLTREEEDRLRLYSGSIIIKGAKSPERLLNEVTLFLHKVETDLPPERQRMLRDFRSRDSALDGRKVLVVDDDVRNVYALTSILEANGAQVCVARNGFEAIKQVQETPELDIVLMDIMMPELDGYEAMRRIRSEKRFAKLPIIALTAKAMKDDQEKCLEAGANDYMPKPIIPDKLLSLLRVWLPTKRGFVT